MILRDDHLRVLRSLHEQSTPDGEWCIYFKHIEIDTGLDRNTVRRCCRYLAKRKLAEFHHLFSYDDGEVAGSGYCISTLGFNELERRTKNDQGNNGGLCEVAGKGLEA